MSLPSGSRLGVYEILDPLGAGGMGEVYRARDLKLGREVAIKVLPDDLAADPGGVARFEREARMLAAVNHPTIAAIYGAEHDGTTRYIVMELVEGETLAQRLATGPLPIADALRVAAQTAEALEVAHGKGVIHRDLKPANIKITPEGKVKVLDFGLAKAMDLPFAGDMSRSPTIVMGDSRPGELIGTPEFMSPEQARGRETDRRTDIWAFGCILFECLTGRRAFTGETVPDAVAAIIHKDPEWSALPARTPARVRELLVRCLEKDSGRRLRDAGDLRLELEAALAGLTGGGGFAQAPSRTRWKTIAAAAVGALLAVAAYVLFRSGPAGEAEPGRQLAVLPFRNLTGSPEGELMGLGLAETVSVRLANVPGLQVVTPRATVEASEADSNFARVARKLGANTLLSGTLQRENDRFRITYRLVDAHGAQLAASALDGSELFALQDRVADGVVRDLRLRRGARRTPTPSGLDTAAEQERYLQAIGLLQRYDRRDSVEKALRILDGLAGEKPSSAIVQAALSRARLALFGFTSDPDWADRALAAADAARALDPSSAEVEIAAGETLLATGRARESAAAFRRALAANPERVEALLGLGRAAAASGEAKEAEAAFRRAAALVPSFAAFNQLGAFYAEGGRWRDSAAMFEKASRAAPDSYRALSNLGGARVGQCDFPGALDAFRKALVLRPEDPVVQSNVGLTQLWTGHAAEAVAALERAVRGAPENFQIWSNLGDAYREATGGAGKAEEAYRRATTLTREALRINPNDAAALSFLATGLARTGRAAEAAEPSRRAVELAPGDPNTLADAAIVAALAGRDADALGWLRKAVAAGFCREVVTRQPEFARLRDRAEFRSILAAPRPAAGS